MEVKLEQMMLADGVTVLEADSFEPEMEIVIVTEDDQKIPVPVGEYEMEDGRMLIVVEEGIISEVKEKEEEEEVEVEEPIEEEAKKEQEMETAKSNPKKVVESTIKESFFSEIEALKKENETLRNLNLSGDLNVSAYLELPIGTHVVGNDAITVAEREVDGYDGNKFMQKYIVSIIPKDANTNLSKDEEVKPISFNPENDNPIEITRLASKKPRTIMDSVLDKLSK